MSIKFVMCFIFAVSYSTYSDTSDTVLTHVCWILATLAVVLLLAIHFHLTDQEGGARHTGVVL